MSDNSIPKKYCHPCKRLRSIVHFYTSKRGLSHQCRECIRRQANAAKRRPLEIRDGRLPFDMVRGIKLFAAIDVSSVHFYRGVSCWEWNKKLDKDGYGLTTYRGHNFRAVRLFYEIFVEIIPPELVLDHLCRNPKCVNPCHTEPVTVQENTLRGMGVSSVNAQKTHCNYGHDLAGNNSYIHSGRRHCRSCQKRRKADYIKRYYQLPFHHPKRVAERLHRNQKYKERKSASQ